MCADRVAGTWGDAGPSGWGCQNDHEASTSGFSGTAPPYKGGLGEAWLSDPPRRRESEAAQCDQWLLYSTEPNRLGSIVLQGWQFSGSCFHGGVATSSALVGSRRRQDVPPTPRRHPRHKRQAYWIHTRHCSGGERLHPRSFRWTRWQGSAESGPRRNRGCL